MWQLVLDCVQRQEEKYKKPVKKECEDLGVTLIHINIRMGK